MQSSRLVHRIGLFYGSAVVGGKLSWAEQDALKERLIDASTLADLSAGDRQLLRDGVFAVSAGNVPGMFADPLEQGDWAAIDAAIDSEDDDALERALDTVGRGYGVAAAGGDFAALEPLSDDLDDDEQRV